MNARSIFQLPMFLVAAALAQETAPSALRGGGGGISVGIRRLDLGEVRSALGARGYGEPSETFLTLGGGGQFQRGKWLLGGEGGAWIPAFGSAEQEGDEVQLAGGWGMARVGWDPSPLGSLHLIPSLGLGAGGLQMKVSHPPTDRFAELLEGPGEISTLEKAGFLVEPAITVEWRTFLARDGEGGNYFSIGLRAAYAWNPWSGSWSNSRGTVAGAPDVDLGGPSLRLVVGMGGCNSRR